MKNVSKRYLIALYALMLSSLFMHFPFLNEPYDIILEVVGVVLGLASVVLFILDLVHDHKAKKQAKEDAESE